MPPPALFSRLLPQGLDLEDLSLDFTTWSIVKNLDVSRAILGL